MRAALLLLLALPLSGQPDRFGLPACSAPDQELATRSAFVLCHSGSFRVPLWTAHELTPARVAQPAGRRVRFRRDVSLSNPGATDADYRNSSYVRGHMVPAADVAWSEEGLRESFLLSNAVPQNGSLNSGKWRTLENAIRRAAATADFVIVFTGPVFCDAEATERIGLNNVAVPCQLFKVVLASRDSQLSAFAAILPNDGNPSEPLEAFLCSIVEVERRTGLRFFDALPAGLRAVLESPAEILP